MKGLFLDDERIPGDVTWIQYPESVEWVVVRTFVDFVEFIDSRPLPDVISFDHDLQDFGIYGLEKTGYDCLKFLIDFCLQNGYNLPVCYFHTQNVVGKENMWAYYNNFLDFMNKGE